VEIDVATRELIKLTLLPPGILILMLLIGWLMARRFFGRFVILLAIVLFYGLSTPMGVNWLASQLETIPPLTPTQLKTSRADAIWVLMAGINRHNPELGGGDRLSWHSLERIDQALALHRKTGLPIIPSGGSVTGDTRPVAQLGSEWLQARAAVKTLAVETASRDTWENAQFSAALFEQQGINRVLLVTHAFHMPRAVLSARAAGIDVVPAPFAYQHTPATLQVQGRYTDWLPQAGHLGHSYLILHEMFGLVWYGFGRV
jgi:uncharacterized SAM-binding protein YcdF (DUF218 family)